MTRDRFMCWKGGGEQVVVGGWAGGGGLRDVEKREGTDGRSEG